MRVMFGAAALIVLGLVVFEVTMEPTTAERVEVGIIFGLMATATAVAAVLLPRVARRVRSLRLTVLAVSIISFSIVTVGIIFSARRMFLSEHDLSLVLVVVGFGVLSALSFALLVSGPLTVDLSSIAGAASRITGGDLESRSSVLRSDEVGSLSLAVDEMAAELQDAEEMRVRDDESRRAFFAAVGHDLRTPLASLRVAIEAIQDGVTSEPARFLDSMERDVEALSRLVDDLFLLARLESGSVDLDSVSVDLTELADEALEMFRPIADTRDVSIRLDASRRTVADARPEAVARVVRNLLDNAVRHSPPGGEIVVTVANGSAAQLTVVDQGPGFPAGFVDHAFDRFSREDAARDRASGGAGLGLAIAHGFVTAMGGDIWAKPGPGGEVGFRLPIPSDRSEETPDDHVLSIEA